MRKYEKKVRDLLYKVEEFESVLELTRINKTRPIRDCWESGAVANRRLGSWYGVSSYEEAYELLSEGWSEGVEKAKTCLKAIENGTRRKIQFVNNVEGFIPNVALSLMNVPNAMINTQTTVVKSKVIDIIYDNTANCDISSEEMIRAGVNLVSFITDLELSGYRCNVKVITSACIDDDGKKIESCIVNIKNANQTFNLKKMMFPLAHSAWLRVVGFDWQDRSPITTYDCGRGQAYYSILKDEDDEYEGKAKRTDFQEVFKNNSYLITYKDAIKGKENLKTLLKIK